MKEKTPREQVNQIAQAIYDKKGWNILALDVRHVSTMADYFIIAEGSVHRHVQALCTAVKNCLSDQNVFPAHIDGESEGNWVVVDFGDIVVHLLTPEWRERYALEELWNEGHIVDLHLQLTPQQTR